MHVCTSTLVIIYLLIYGAASNAASGGNCQTQGSSSVQRHFYYHVKHTTIYNSSTISIAQTSYFTQRLLNEILRQTLVYKLGYSDVSLVDYRPEYAANNLLLPVSNCSISVTFFPNSSELLTQMPVFEQNFTDPLTNQFCVVLDWPPESLIVLDHTEEPRSAFTNLGPLGFSTRYGIYMTKDALSATNPRNDYTSLSDPLVLDNFTRSDNRQTLELAAKLFRETNGSTCPQQALCSDGIYAPALCQYSNVTCAVLMVGDIDDDTFENLRSKIENLRLRLKVAFLGDELTSFVTELSGQGHPVIFFTKSPDLLTTNQTYSRVSFDDYCFPDPTSCDFHVQTVQKTVWSPLAKAEKLVAQFMKKMVINRTEIQSLLLNYSKEFGSDTSQASIEQFVCSLLNSHTNNKSAANSLVFSDWIPDGVNKKPSLLIGGLFPIWNKGVWKQPNLIPAVTIALEKVNADNQTLREYDLDVIESDTGCDSSWVLNIFTQYILDDDIWSRMVGGLGPACSDTALAIASLAKHYNYVLISYSVEAMVLSIDRNRYPYFFRTIPQINEYAKVYVTLFKKLGWVNSRVSMLTDDSSGEFPVYHRNVADEFKQQGIELVSQELLPRYEYLPDHSYSKYLDKIKKLKSKVIIVDVYADVAKSILCEALSKEMTLKQGYVWFIPSVFRWDWYDTDYDNPYKIPCSTDQMIEAVKGYFTLAHSNIDKTNTVAVGGLTGSQFYEQYDALVKKKPIIMKYPSEFGSYAYDAVWAFAKALDALHQENPAYLRYIHTPYATQQYVKKIKSTTFQGVSGLITFNDKGDRSGITDINQYVDTGSDGFLVPTWIGTWTPSTNGTMGDLHIDEGKINFLDSLDPGVHNEAVPPGIERCPWESLSNALGADCSGSLVFVVVLPCLLVLVAFILIIFTYVKRIKRRYDIQKVYADRRGPVYNLDDQEIPRSNIVLNRKLGEGAFGTVYGGEGYINSAWIGVAVKTLKVGSNSAQKLDFLREADIMKRFDHKNIIKLYGVTTVGEPAYAIMEFMLFGDLKTYLLSRRELVGTDSKEAEDVSAASLTNMAMDIIEGLNYLHVKEYVHRDIACRNCLVAANRVVKIGDFGMTRRVYDDGVYVFTGRAKLPVRWMAPESLERGHFTYKTDIWSYGILLYELITFGSIPYQMLSDTEVFESVRSGAIQPLPEECTDELKTLILACWSMDPFTRPNASDIYGMLHHNENIIQPLLASPAFAKIRENESTEMDMSPAPLKSGPIWKKPMLRQSSSVISVDTGATTASRLRHPSEISTKKSSNKRKSGHSIIDLSSIQTANNTSSPIPVSMPSPSHSAGHTSSFLFTADKRNASCCDDVFSEGRASFDTFPTQRCRHQSGDSADESPHIGENHYLLTMRSLNDAEEKPHTSHTPLLTEEETSLCS